MSLLLFSDDDTNTPGLSTGAFTRTAFESTAFAVDLTAIVAPSRLREVQNTADSVFAEGDNLWRGRMIKRRQGDLLPPIKAIAFTAGSSVDMTQFASIQFRMVSGSTVITGTAIGDASGNLSYDLNPGDTDTIGTYNAVFVATDPTGREETFPTGTNLTVQIVAAI